MRDPQSGEDPFPVREGEELEFPRELDRGGLHAASAIASLPGNGDDAKVAAAGSPPTARPRAPPILLGATREFRAHLPDERRELPRGLRSGPYPRWDDVNIEPTLTRGGLLLEIHTFRALTSRADEDSVHAQTRNTSAARQAP